MAENYLLEHTNKKAAILRDKKQELADLDADMEDFMNVATDGNYNLKLLNDAFEGKAAENEEIELVNEMGEMKIKTRTKRPPKPEQPASKAKKIVEKAKATEERKTKL